MTFEEIDGLAQRRSELDPKAWAASDEAVRNHWRRKVIERGEAMDEMTEHSRLLIELNEPEALIESLKRACQRKAGAEIQPEEAARWRTAASALSDALTTIAASQEPKRASNEPDEPIPQPGPIPSEGLPSPEGTEPGQDNPRA